ncbi:hypothetical protein OT109_18395 [Phycisphaeraceae bacterium D3-23]
MQPIPRPQNAGPKVVKQGPSPAKLLASVPRRPLTPEQQLAAVNKVQQQADHRIKLGQQLFKAAEARLSQHHDLLEQVRAEQQGLREQVQDDVAKSLQSYDQWMGRIDEGFTQAIRRLDERIDQTQRDLTESRGQMQQMLAQVGAMMDQTQQLLSEAFGEMPQAPETTSEQARTTAVGIEIVPPASMPDPIEETLTTQPDTPSENGESEPTDIFGQLLDQLRDPRDDDVAA